MPQPRVLFLKHPRILLLAIFFSVVGAWGQNSARQSGAEAHNVVLAQHVEQTHTGQPAYTLPPDLLRKAIALTRLRTILSFGDAVSSVLLLLLILGLRWPAYLRNFAERTTARRWLQGLLFLPPSILFLSIISLPLAIYSQHVERRYGLSVQSWTSWTADQGKGLALSLLVFTPLLMLLFWIIRRSPQSWWLWFWLATLPVILFGVFIAPLWIDPMFNHFSPLQKSDPQLVIQLEQLAQHAGLDIPPSRMFLMRASEKVTGLNAYVTGVGASKRIVVWDTTIQKLPPDEILFIAGHEMGHYVLNHIYKGLAFTGLLLFALLWLARQCILWLLVRYRHQWEIRGQDDWAALAVFVLVATFISFLSSPVTNAFSRWEEHQADIFGQEAIHGLVTNPQKTAVQAFNALGRVYLESPDPNPAVEFWLDSHPSISQRAEFALHYNPWRSGKHPRYFAK